MGYYNNRNRGYNPGYGSGGYNPGWGGTAPYQGRQQFDKFNNPTFGFDIGEKVIHSATGIELSVISYGREQLECRKPDLNTIWCYPHELEHIAPSSK